MNAREEARLLRDGQDVGQHGKKVREAEDVIISLALLYAEACDEDGGRAGSERIRSRLRKLKDAARRLRWLRQGKIGDQRPSRNRVYHPKKT